MTLASSIEGASLLGAGGVALGSVVRVLYHPQEPRAIGVMVRGPSIYGMVERRDTFLPLAAVRFKAGAVSSDLRKLPTGRNAADGLGFDPDTTVMWSGMPVLGPSEQPIGVVAEVEFDPASGGIATLEVAGGAVADVAHGRFLVPGALVDGYRAGAVRVTAEAGELETTGGMARVAAQTAVATSEAAKSAAAAGEAAILDASRATGRAIKSIKDARVAEKTTDRVKSTWRDTIKAFREGKDDKE